MKHPNVARMYDFGTGGGHPYITMEFIPGKDLQTLILEEGRIAPARALPILRQICLGTQAAHEQGIVHRDLKSQNIIVGDGRRRRRSSTSASRAALVDEKLTLDAVVLGTPHYISPEQAMGQPADARSDIYSIGIIAFEMLTGVLPFTADSALGIAMKQISEPVPGNLSLYPDVSPRLRAAVHRALEKRREDRFQSASDLEAALARAAEARARAAPGRRRRGDEPRDRRRPRRTSTPPPAARREAPAPAAPRRSDARRPAHGPGSRPLPAPARPPPAPPAAAAARVPPPPTAPSPATLPPRRARRAGRRSSSSWRDGAERISTGQGASPTPAATPSRPGAERRSSSS